MQFIQAKKLDNKLKVRDNRPYAIEKVEFLSRGGFVMTLLDEEGYSFPLAYRSMERFREEFNVVNYMKGLEPRKELEE